MSYRSDHPPNYGGKHSDTLMENIVTESLNIATVPGDVLAMQTQPPPPALGLFPPRFGYGRIPVRVEDIIVLERESDAFRNQYWTGGGGQGYTGSQRNSFGGG